MPQSTDPQLDLLDLTRTVPQGIKLTGLSGPQSDGINYFRVPTALHSQVDFTVIRPSFVQLEYQLYSARQDIQSSVLLDGREVGATTFPKGKFISNAKFGDFLLPGQHSFALKYSCAQACAAIHQYWTRVSILDASSQQAAQDTGLGVERWRSYAPASPLKLRGVGPLNFDGVNYLKTVEAPQVQMTWPRGVKALDVNFQFNADQDFQVITRVGRKVIDTQQGSAGQSVNRHLSLVGQPQNQGLSFEVKCLKTLGSNCASLYFPELTVLRSARWETSGTGALAGAVILIGCLFWFLGLFPRRIS